jgi:hypothetical protein
MAERPRDTRSSHSEKAQDDRRRSSIAASLGGGFQTVNIVKPLPTVTQAHEPQSSSIAYYRPGAHWEGLHRYDEQFTWNPSEERHLVRKASTIRLGVSPRQY